jgi:hypothetical protein
MDFDYLRKTTAANLASLTNLAFLTPKKRRNRVKDLTNFSTLVWKPEGKNTFGYKF